MLRNTVLAGLLGSVLFFETAAAADRVLSFTTINYPDAASTVLEGINPQGDIVGLYTDAAGVTHGFVLHRGVFTSIDYPGAAYTDVRAINPRGDILGNYRMPGEDPSFGSHGFVLKCDGTLIPLTYTGHINMIAQRILPDDSVVGCYHDHDFMASMRGFLWSGGNYTALDGSYHGLDVPISMNNGATPDLSQIAGLFYDMTFNRNRAYVLQNGIFVPFDYPGASLTQAWDMNPSGAIVGNYRDSTGAHGFLLENGVFTSLQFPGEGPTITTAARGINPRGDIVGWYRDATNGGQQQGFLATRHHRKLER